ncbi:hypothetical protein FNF29_05263 [Cafeteria roenbergensis]|uniref:Penicillin amidase n=1 Tax=Cafeteria roenbergensis TaxID=33653 RepID=A0A5A8CEH6_CAFRO|nr:hypothetical protein FNF29_05263 [Cafeteria roenbergensis]|eukprot:KAA0150460.1 hypothetical protein FNF29_05263 [Cafeteria roenbergensis]
MAGPVATLCRSARLRAGLAGLVALLSILAFAGFVGSLSKAIINCAEILGPVTAVFLLALAGCLAMAAFCCRAAVRAGAEADSVSDDSVAPLSGSSKPDAEERPSRCRCVSLHLAMTLCGIATIALWVVAAMAVWLTTSTIPSLTGTLKLPGLSKPVHVIHEDQSGMVHIEAEGDLADGYFALGVVHAQLRLWQMHFQRSVGAGRLAEAVGAPALPTDKLMRTLGVYTAAKEASLALPRDAAMAVDSYVSGVNAYLATNPPLPVEFVLLGLPRPEPWTRADSLVWAKLMAYDLAGNLNSEITRFRLMARQGLSPERIEQLMPPYDMTQFPVALSPADLGLGGEQFGCDASLRSAATDHAEPLEGRKRGLADGPVAGAADAVSRAAAIVATALRSAAAPRRAAADAAAARRVPESWVSPVGLPGWISGSARDRPPAPRPGVRPDRQFGNLGASNNWVVSGNRTTTGKPLLCNDPHLTLMAPSIWLAVSIKTARGGEIVRLNPTLPDSAADLPVAQVGATFVGLPGVVIGRNSRIAWGVTNTGADVQDLYVMQAPANGSSAAEFYAFEGSNVAYERRTETFKVAGSADVSITVRRSRFGPVVTDNGLFSDLQPAEGQSGAHADMSLRWISLERNVDDTTLAAFLRVGLASDHSEWTAALQDYVAPSQNMIYADVDGNIAYRMTGLVPVRAGGRSGRWPVAGDGQGNDWDWNGFIPFEEMPATLNPPEGFIVTANNRITPPAYKHNITFDWDAGSNGYRAKRITDMVCAGSSGGAKLSAADMRRIQLDSTTYLGRDVAMTVAAKLENSKLTPEAQAGKRALEGWDHSAAVGSTVQTTAVRLFAAMARLAGEETGTDVWGDAMFALRAMRNGDPACQRADGDASCQTYFAKALHNASVADGHPAEWGTPGRHMATFTHQVLGKSPLGCLADRTVGHGGDFSTVNVGHSKLSDPAFPQTAGPSYRQVVDLASPASSLFLNPLGQNGNLFSKHYDNLVRDWAEGEYLPMTTVAGSSDRDETQTMTSN